MKKQFDWKKYILVLIITILLFVTAGWLSNWFGAKKVDQLKGVQDKIAIDIMSSETQFSLLSELSCTDVSNSNLSKELNSLAEKIDYAEKNLNSDDVMQLKKYYSLLEIKDSLLMHKITDRCGKKIVSILYFYTTAENCSECTKQGFVLSQLRNKYPDLRVYSFDYSLDLSALDALKKIYDVQDTKLPALVIDNKVYTGFHSTDDIMKIAPKIAKLQTTDQVDKMKKK